MTKKDLAGVLYDEIGFSRRESAEIVNFFFDLMREKLIAGEKVKLPGFGTFMVTRRKSRIGRNPSTGEEVDIPSRLTVVFKPSRFLRKKVDQKRGD